MSLTILEEGRERVRAARHATAAHKASWEALVPDQFTVNLEAEEAEEDAFAAMVAEKRRLREHISATYGISIRELAGLAID